MYRKKYANISSGLKTGSVFLQYDYIIAIPVYFYNVTSYYIHLYYRKTYCEGKGAAFGWGITYLLTPMFLLSHAVLINFCFILYYCTYSYVIHCITYILHNTYCIVLLYSRVLLLISLTLVLYFDIRIM